ncbi:MAG: glycosyltransferase [Microbacterium sp.]
MANTPREQAQVVPPGVTTDDYEVVLVTYHSRDQLEGLLDAVRPDQRIVVVDNGSGVDDVGELLEPFDRARLLDGQNVGFARAATLGAMTSDAEYVIFANPDSRPTPEIWDALVRDLRDDPGLGSVAAATTSPTGEIELGVGGWEPSPRRVFVYAFGLHLLFPRAGVYAKPRPGEDIQLDWITGACLAVRREVFAELGGFDGSFFVYNEDMAFGRSLREAGYRQRLRTDLLVPHATSGSGGGTRMPQQKGASMSQYLVTRHGRIAATFMRGCLATGSLLRAGVAAVTRRPSRAHHVAYAKGIVTQRSPYKP